MLDLTDRVALVTGGYGMFVGGMADALAAAGARVAVLGRRQSEAEAKVRTPRSADGTAMALSADVLDEDSLRAGRERLIAE